MDGATEVARTPHDARPGYLVGRFDRMIRRRFESILGEQGLTIAQYTTLSVVAARPGLANAQLARRALITAQGMNTVVTALERLGLVERRRDAEGGRRLPVGVTERGRELLEVCDERTARAEAELLAPLTAEQRETFLSCLQQVTEIGHRMDGDG